MPDLTVRPLTVARWADLEALFAARGCGAARRCWCMYYRRTGRASELSAGRTRADASRAALRRIVLELHNDGVGGLAYLPGESLLGDDGEATVDSSHPTDLGFMRQADALEPAIRAVL